jgi:hypothetical protein
LRGTLEKGKEERILNAGSQLGCLGLQLRVFAFKEWQEFPTQDPQGLLTAKVVFEPGKNPQTMKPFRWLRDGTAKVQ